MLELLVYLKYIMDDDKLSGIYVVLSNTEVWHCLKVRRSDDDKLEAMKYIGYETQNEVDLLGFLPAVIQYFDTE